MSWTTWASGVLSGIGAPGTAVNLDTLYAWSNAETAPYDLMRWNNPLNTTEKYGTSFNSGAQPGPHDVQVYASVQDGINATVLTLANGYYPIIVSHLRNSVPRQQWSDACAELKLWGTGCGWIDNVYGPAPQGADDLTAAQEQTLNAIYAILEDQRSSLLNDPNVGLGALHNQITALKDELDALKAAVAALQQPTVTVPTQITLSATGTLHS